MDAIDGGSSESPVSTMVDPPPPKIATHAGSDCASDKESDIFYIGERRFRKANVKDKEFQRQSLLFEDQFVRSEGFEITWDKFDYMFDSFDLAWWTPLESDKTNEQLVRIMINDAIDKHNEENGANLEFVKHVKTNFWGCAGYCFWITFLARDLSSNSDIKVYQTKVRRFMGKNTVRIFRERPTDEEIASVHVELPEYECFK
ncbi:unnamed protein product [Cuscuta epithymum]|uniref:Uncharacterized protein n=1 Tax=Cuscuta epithymum TaxID=186058 RepID=A0AAV0GA79_9ASTE|nr:unnamed protein product [Cuscuta epithymum]